MNEFAAGFGSPLTTTRPRGARQLEARSPKLGLARQVVEKSMLMVA